jgi:hypothetical protein
MNYDQCFIKKKIHHNIVQHLCLDYLVDNKYHVNVNKM